MNTILRIPHPVEGSVDILADEKDVVIKAHWPFDLQADEWVDITGRFRQEDLTRLATLVIEQSGPHSIESEHDHLTLERAGETFSFDLSRGGVVPRRLILDFPLEHLQALSAATPRGDA
ncbi:hypothetical protein KBZ94_14680 [Streptomyces sp. RM72]|uniref:hypothetical protein n=1 Tax=unclassified Streptomyces TaxID=2593676 RepID=UPI000978E97B|nr:MULTISPECIES: hypothetical protein [unclassified Streptomyces]MBQ0886161.1 hypothetical protein [Streptomyces sp. RM72]OMI89246.1 hypothetical protein BSZ07_14425 [Streptomyces sp. M1013]